MKQYNIDEIGSRKCTKLSTNISSYDEHGQSKVASKNLLTIMLEVRNMDLSSTFLFILSTIILN